MKYQFLKVTALAVLQALAVHSHDANNAVAGFAEQKDAVIDKPQWEKDADNAVKKAKNATDNAGKDAEAWRKVHCKGGFCDDSVSEDGEFDGEDAGFDRNKKKTITKPVRKIHPNKPITKPIKRKCRGSTNVHCDDAEDEEFDGEDAGFDRNKKKTITKPVKKIQPTKPITKPVKRKCLHSTGGHCDDFDSEDGEFEGEDAAIEDEPVGDDAAKKTSDAIEKAKKASAEKRKKRASKRAERKSKRASSDAGKKANDAIEKAKKARSERKAKRASKRAERKSKRSERKSKRAEKAKKRAESEAKKPPTAVE